MDKKSVFKNIAVVLLLLGSSIYYYLQTRGDIVDNKGNSSKDITLKAQVADEKPEVIAEEALNSDSALEEDTLAKDDNKTAQSGERDSNTEKIGFLKKSSIRNVVSRRFNSLKYCHQKELPKSPGLEGRVILSWTIKPDGKVADIKVRKTTLNNENVEKCIIRKVKRWKFPKPEGNGDVKISYPFVFKVDK